jgi:Carboxypeptidase regulatory-like domain
MSAEMMVAPHPYYAVTDESGQFEFRDVPPGTYKIVAWHEGWGVIGKELTYDVLSQEKVGRPVFTLPKTWEKPVTVTARQTSQVNFVVSNK